MKKVIKKTTQLKTILLAALLLLAFHSQSQQLKPSASGYAPARGIKVYYEVYGEGRPILLLHGAFMTIEGNWSQLIPELAKTRKVIAIEMQGHGHTPYSDRPMSHVTLAEDAASVLDYLKVDSADVVGYSMGGSVAYGLAIKNPKRVKKLVIISSTYKSTGWLPEINNAFKAFKPEFFDNTPMKSAYEAVAPDKTKWRSFIQQMIGFASVPFDLGDDNISKLPMPVLIIAGDNDGLDKSELMKTYKLLGGGVSADMSPMPKSQLAVVPGQSHVSLMMQTPVILGYLNGFLK